jgi:hypothetical protein
MYTAGKRLFITLTTPRAKKGVQQKNGQRIYKERLQGKKTQIAQHVKHFLGSIVSRETYFQSL